jgi:hypothetical protein
MIVIAATLAPITTTVVAREGVAASSGSSHPPGDRFVLSGQDRSSLCPDGCFWKPWRRAWPATGSPANASSARESTSRGAGDTAATKQTS